MATDLSGSKIDFFHIFHVQLFEHTDGTGVFKAAFKRQIMDFFFCKIKTKLMKAGRHLDGTKIIFHGFNAGKGSLLKSVLQGMSNILTANWAKRSGFAS